MHTSYRGRPSAHTDGKNNLKRNSFRQNDQRDSGREASEFSYHQQSPKKYIPQTGSEQCARGYQICHAGRHCGSGGILYLKQKSVPKINPNTPIHTDLEQRPIIKPHLCTNRCHLKELSLYSYPISPLPKQTPGFGVINHAKLSRCNSPCNFSEEIIRYPSSSCSKRPLINSGVCRILNVTSSSPVEPSHGLSVIKLKSFILNS